MLLIILVVFIIITAGFISYIYLMPEEEKKRVETEKEIDDRISPLVGQAIFIEVQRIRAKGIIDQMINPTPLIRKINNLPIKEKGWIVPGESSYNDILKAITGILPGKGWDEKPTFLYETTIDDFDWRVEETEYNCWDTDYIFNEFYKQVEQERETSNVEFRIIEKFEVKKIGRNTYREELMENFKMTYDYRTGTWTGDDYFNDSDGYGHYNGTNYEIWFNIRQTDLDGDSIPYWTEVNILGTDPRIDDSKLDPDEDGCNTAWEWKWGYDPFTYDEHIFLDPDHDGLQNVEEEFMYKWLANPFHPDMYIESDYSGKAPFEPYKIEWQQGKYLPIYRPTIVETRMWGQEHVFWEESQQMIIERFNEHGITVHIDDGSMGGGGEILPFLCMEYGITTEPAQMSEFYKKNLADERKGIFRYVLVTHTKGWAYNSDNQGHYNTIVVAQNNKFYIKQTDYAISPRAKRIAQAISLLHEIGHTCGFGYTHNGGVDNISSAGFIEWYDYRSVMNYFWYRNRYFDYSDGTHGPNDTNDWARLDVSYFQKTAEKEEMEGIEFDRTQPPYNR